MSTKRRKAHQGPAVPAQARPAHNPLPWALVFGVAAGAQSGIIDANGKLVFEFAGELTDLDVVNLELMVGAANGKRPCRAHASQEPEAGVAPFSIEEIQPTGGA